MIDLKKLEEIRLILTQIRELQKQIREADKPLSSDAVEADGRKWQYWRGQNAEGRQRQARQREALRTAGTAYDSLYSSLYIDIDSEKDLSPEQKKILKAFYLKGLGYADSAREAGIDRPEAIQFLKDYKKSQGNIQNDKCQDKESIELSLNDEQQAEPASTAFYLNAVRSHFQAFLAYILFWMMKYSCYQ